MNFEYGVLFHSFHWWKKKYSPHTSFLVKFSTIFIKIKFAQYVYVLILIYVTYTDTIWSRWYRCIFCQFWKSLIWKRIRLLVFFRKSFLKSNLLLLLSNEINHMRYWFVHHYFMYSWLEYWNFLWTEFRFTKQLPTFQFLEIFP